MTSSSEETSSEESEDEDDDEEEEGSTSESDSSEEATPAVKAKVQSSVAVKASKEKQRKKGGEDLKVEPKDSSLLDLDDCKQQNTLLTPCLTTLVC